MRFYPHPGLATIHSAIGLAAAGCLARRQPRRKPGEADCLFRALPLWGLPPWSCLGTGTWAGRRGQAPQELMGMGCWGQARWANWGQGRIVGRSLGDGRFAPAAMESSRGQAPFGAQGLQESEGDCQVPIPIGPWGHAWGKCLFPVRSYPLPSAMGRHDGGTGTSAIATEGYGGRLRRRSAGATGSCSIGDWQTRHTCTATRMSTPRRTPRNIP